MGESVGQRWNREIKQRVRKSRVRGTQFLIDGLMESGVKPEVIISASAIGYYGNRGDETLNEDSGPGDDYLAETGVAWEEEACRAESLGVRVVLLRTGVVLGPGGGALSKMLFPFKMGVGGPIGNGRQWFSWIHLDDVTGLILYALDHESVKGPMNTVSPAPVTNKEFARALGKSLKRPAFLPAPAFAMKLMFGEFATLGLLASQRVLPKKAEEYGYKFQYPELGPALDEILNK